MKYVVYLLLLSLSWTVWGEVSGIKFTNHMAENPRFTVWKTTRLTQITYDNGNDDQPEIVIIVCDRKTRDMHIQYFIQADGIQVVDAEYITILRYPKGWLKMTLPYYPPSEVIYDGGMGLNKNRLASALRRLTLDPNWGIVFTFEGITNEYGTETKAWSEVIPGFIFKRDLMDQDISDCEFTEGRQLFPLLKVSHETD